MFVEMPLSARLLIAAKAFSVIIIIPLALSTFVYVVFIYYSRTTIHSENVVQPTRSIAIVARNSVEPFGGVYVG